MTDTNIHITIRSKNDNPRLDGFNNTTTGEGYSIVTSKCNADDGGVLKPKGRTSTENSATKRTEASHRIAKERMRIGTWNVRTMNNGNLGVVKREIARTGVDLLGISEMKWTGMGHFTSDEYEIYYSGQETLKRNGVAFICNNEIRRCVLGFNPVDDRITTIRIQCKPINITVVQIYAPTSSAEEDSDAFYDKVQSVLDQIPNGDILYIIGDWNAKVGKELSIDITGNFGLGKRNERGDQLVEFCSRNDLRIMNTFFKLHPRRLYTWISPDNSTRNQIDYILCKSRWKSSIKRVTTLPGADCGTDHNLPLSDIKVKLKRIKRSMQAQIYDVEKIGLDYSVEIKNRFNALQTEDRTPDELWIDIRTILIETANKKVPKVKRKKVSKWISEEALKFAKERKDMRSKGKYEEYRKLNAAFQKKARQDKEQSIREKCRKIEELNKIGKTRDLFKEIKETTGSRSSRGCAMKLSNGKVVSE